MSGLVGGFPCFGFGSWFHPNGRCRVKNGGERAVHLVSSSFSFLFFLLVGSCFLFLLPGAGMIWGKQQCRKNGRLFPNIFLLEPGAVVWDKDRSEGFFFAFLVSFSLVFPPLSVCASDDVLHCVGT